MPSVTAQGFLTGVAVVVLTMALPARAGLIADRPDAIICSVSDPTGVLPWDELVFYISAHTRNGRTLYKTLTSAPVVLIVDADDVINGANLADCDGRSIDELRNEERAVDWSRG